MTSVLVVDDSRLVRSVVGTALADHGHDVTTASDGREAVELVRSDGFDAIVMDVEMPELGGIEAMERILGVDPTPVVVVSGHVEPGDRTTMKALGRGAVDVLPKPTGEREIDDLQDDLVTAVDRALTVDPDVLGTARSVDEGGTESEPVSAPGDGPESAPAPGDGSSPPEPASPGDDADGNRTTAPDDGANAVRETAPGGSETPAAGDGSTVTPKATGDGPPTVVIGASTGGPDAVEAVLSGLSTAVGARVLVVQHMPESFTSRMAAHLDDVSEYDVSEATDGDVVRPGAAVVAKGDAHLHADAEPGDGLRIRLSRGEPVNSVRPAADVTMQSVAETASGPVAGVVLSGMGTDGAAGVRAITGAGGVAIVQDEATSQVFGMPQQAISTGDVDLALPPASIPDAIREAFDDQEREEVHV